MDNQALVSGSNTQNDSTAAGSMPVPAGQLDPKASRVSVDQLLLAGAHFGHLTRKWNPKMKPYIFMARNGIYLLDLHKTQKAIELACKEITKIASKGDEILFVGTKRQARDIVEEEAKRGGCPYVTYRWLGGMLTNYSTIRKSLKTLEGFERMRTDGTWEKIKKKEQLSVEKSSEKLNRTLGGIRDMKRLPGAIFIVDTMVESIAVAEANKLGIPIFAIVDTNADPEGIDYPIPANDDAFKSIWLISRTITEAILEGKKRVQDERDHINTDSGRDNKSKPRGGNKPRRRRKPRKKPAGEGSHTKTEGNQNK